MKIKEKVIEIINHEMEEIRHMEQEDGENDISFNIRKQHYLAELKAIKHRMITEIN